MCKLGLLFSLLWSIIKIVLRLLWMEISMAEPVNREGLGHLEDRCSLTQISELTDTLPRCTDALIQIELHALDLQRCCSSLLLSQIV